MVLADGTRRRYWLMFLADGARQWYWPIGLTGAFARLTVRQVNAVTYRL